MCKTLCKSQHTDKVGFTSPGDVLTKRPKAPIAFRKAKHRLVRQPRRGTAAWTLAIGRAEDPAVRTDLQERLDGLNEN